MKRPVELDIMDIADKLIELAEDAAMLALVGEGLHRMHRDRGIVGIIRRAHAMHDELEELSGRVCRAKG